MKTAVVILNWNTKDFLSKFLPGLLQSVAGHDAEVIVADSASTDGSMDLLQAEFPQVRTIALDRNYGFTGGYNCALAEVEAEYFVLINSDIEVDADWLAPLEDWMDRNPSCAACAPKLLSFYDHALFEYAGAAGGCIDSLGYTFCRGRVMKRVEADMGQYDMGPCRIAWATGACLMVRSADWRAHGGLDGRFFAHMEEIDLCWRMRLAGKEIVVVPSSVVYHLGGGTLPKESPWKMRLNFRNNLLMLENNLAKEYRALGHSVWASIIMSRALIMLRMCLDGLSALVFLATGKLSFAREVARAHSEYRKLRTRETTGSLRTFSAPQGYRRHGYLNGSIVLLCLLKREKVFEFLRNKVIL